MNLCSSPQILNRILLKAVEKEQKMVIILSQFLSPVLELVPLVDFTFIIGLMEFITPDGLISVQHNSIGGLK